MRILHDVLEMRVAECRENCEVAVFVLRSEVQDYINDVGEKRLKALRAASVDVTKSFHEQMEERKLQQERDKAEKSKMERDKVRAERLAAEERRRRMPCLQRETKEWFAKRKARLAKQREDKQKLPREGRRRYLHGAQPELGLLQHPKPPTPRANDRWKRRRMVKAPRWLIRLLNTKNGNASKLGNPLRYQPLIIEELMPPPTGYKPVHKMHVAGETA